MFSYQGHKASVIEATVNGHKKVKKSLFYLLSCSVGLNHSVNCLWVRISTFLFMLTL